MTSIELIATSLCVWRLSKMVTEEEGPFEVFKHIRSRFPIDGKRGWIGRGLYCLWCMSFWFGLLIGLATAPNVFSGFVFGLASSTLAILYDHCFEYMLQRMAKR